MVYIILTLVYIYTRTHRYSTLREEGSGAFLIFTFQQEPQGAAGEPQHALIRACPHFLKHLSQIILTLQTIKQSSDYI